MPKAAKKKAAKKPAARNVSRKTKARPKRKQRETRKMPSIDKGATEETKTDKKSGPGATPGKPDPDAKDKPEMGAVGEDPTEKKHTPPPDKQPHTDTKIHNRDQDPRHPANRTQSVEADPSPRPVAEGITVPPEELLTEQEKEAAAAHADPRAGVGPYAPSRSTTGPAKTIEDEGIGPRTPYPTGNPPPPSVSASLSQGIWKGDEEEDGGPNSARDSAIRDAFHDGTTKDDYHRGDTVTDGPDRDRARREKERDAQQGTRDSRPQQRIGGAQEMTTPPKESGK